MSANEYQLMFSGELAEGATRDQVQTRLASVFNKQPAELAPLFSGELMILKRAASPAELEPLRDVLARAGAIARIGSLQAPAAQPAAGSAPTAPAGSGASGRDAPSKTGYSLDEFVAATREREREQGSFELESPRVLELNLDGEIWIKSGTMIAYTGDIQFTRESLLAKGLAKLLKKSATGEGARLTKAEGLGRLYLADAGKKVTILRLDGDAISVNGNDILAFESSIDWDIRFTKRMSTLLAGGLFNVRLQGMGLLAITTHYEPMTLRVRADSPVYTDPNATVAWSVTLEPKLKTDVSFKTFLGRGSGDSIQACFEGDGFVVVQPYEERTLQRS